MESVLIGLEIVLIKVEIVYYNAVDTERIPKNLRVRVSAQSNVGILFYEKQH